MQLNDAKTFPLSLAPMVGLSHAVLRQLIREYMPANAQTVWPTEMLNSRRLPEEVLGRNSETLVLPHENNICPQILGNDKQAIQRSIDRLAKNWRLEGIDINMGCPVQKALRHNYGVALMGDFDYAKSVVSMAAESTRALQLKLSVKLRAVDSTKTNVETKNFVHGLIEAGATRITLHPRTAEQQRRGKADWKQIKILVDEFSKVEAVEIVGNGDIQTAEDVFLMMQETGVRQVMSGRALTAKPWMMWQVGERLGFKPPPGRELQRAPITELEEGAEFGRMMIRFVELVEEIFIGHLAMNESLALRKIQFFVRTNHVWLEFGHAFMSTVNTAKSIAECKGRILAFFQIEQRMLQTTDLRQ